jgi:uncharacterized membrane protein YidH (DUF202 family)
MYIRAHGQLANRRTFLVWLRTGLSLMRVSVAGEFVPAHSIPGVPSMRRFSALFVSSGTIMAPFGTSRYMNSYHRIARHSFDTAGKAIVSMSASVALSSLLPNPLLLWLR